jgi:predicted acylesterase/phospholipase RssA
MLRVLAIDGGGLRGIIPARILQSLEDISHRQIFELFDLIVGTSTGGILALGLTRPTESGRPLPAAEFQRIYTDEAQRIFPQGGEPLIRHSGLLGDRGPLPPNASLKQRWEHFMGYENLRKTFAPFGGQQQGSSRYSPQGLEEVLHQYFGDTRLTEALKPVAITSYDYSGANPVLFQSETAVANKFDFYMRDVARATSAGPTYFPPLVLKLTATEQLILADGGLAMNDPALIGFALGLARRDSPKSLVIVSLGTGVVDPRAPDDITFQLVDESNWLSLAKDHLFRAIGDGPAQWHEQLLDLLLNSDGRRRLWRFQTVLKRANHAMDDSRPENIRALVADAEEFAQQATKELQECLKSLEWAQTTERFLQQLAAPATAE